MGMLNGIKDNLGIYKYINTIGELLHEFKAHYEERASLAKIPVENYIDWMPQLHKKDFITHRLEPSSLPALIRSCYCWRFRVQDRSIDN